MSVLIVEPEIPAQLALMKMLKKSGSAQVFLARSSSEAKRVISRQRNNLQVILIDQAVLEISHEELIETINKHPELSACAVIVMPSMSAVSLEGQWISTLPRVDHYLRKPFRRKKMVAACQTALVYRQLGRSAVIIWTKRMSHEIAGLLDSEAIVEERGIHWNEAILVHNKHDFKQLVAKHSNRLGAVLVDPEALDEKTFLSFSRSHLGSLTIRVCLSMAPDISPVLRAQCQIFSQPKTKLERIQLLQKMSSRARSSPYLHFALNSCRRQIRIGKIKEAKKLMRQRLRITKENAEELAIMAEIEFRSGDLRAAVGWAKKAIEINPYLPSPYLFLLRAQLEKGFPIPGDWIERSKSFCSRHPEILSLLEGLKR